MAATKQPPSTATPSWRPSSHISPSSSKGAGIQAKPSLNADTIKTPAPATQHPRIKEEDAGDEEESNEQPLNLALSKQLHSSKEDAKGRNSKKSESESHGNGSLPAPNRHTPDLSSAKQILLKRKPVDRLADLFEAYRRTQKRKTAPSTPEAEDGGTAKKSNLFQRFFTLEDEAALLNTVIAFKEENGHEPASSVDFDALHASVKMFLHADCSKRQIRRKFNHLKDKYSTQFRGEKEGKRKGKGKTPEEISDPKEQAVFELARKIWGEGKTDKGVESEGGKAPEGEPMVNDANFESLDPDPLACFPNDDSDEALIINFIANEFKYMSYQTVKKKLANMSRMERREVDDIWNEFQDKEMEFQRHRLETAKQIVDKLKGKPSG